MNVYSRICEKMWHHTSFIFKAFTATECSEVFSGDEPVTAQLITLHSHTVDRPTRLDSIFSIIYRRVAA
jgi:hypothetical protein